LEQDTKTAVHTVQTDHLLTSRTYGYTNQQVTINSISKPEPNIVLIQNKSFWRSPETSFPQNNLNHSLLLDLINRPNLSILFHILKETCVRYWLDNKSVYDNWVSRINTASNCSGNDQIETIQVSRVQKLPTIQLLIQITLSQTFLNMKRNSILYWQPCMVLCQLIW